MLNDSWAKPKWTKLNHLSDHAKRSVYRNNGENVWVIHGKIDVNRCRNYNDVVPLRTHTQIDHIFGWEAMRVHSIDRLPKYCGHTSSSASHKFPSFCHRTLTIEHRPSAIITQIGCAPSAMVMARPLCTVTNSLHQYYIGSMTWHKMGVYGRNGRGAERE